MSAEGLVIKALDLVVSRNIRVVRGAMFDWCRPGLPGPPEYGVPRLNVDPAYGNVPVPTACNHLGAVVFAMGREQNFVEDFPSEPWFEPVAKFLDTDVWWLWRFGHGFNRGNVLTITYTKGGKEHVTQDEVSRLGDAIARKYAGVG